MSDLIRHKIARCRWCGGDFIRVYQTQWICENDACQHRQIAAAILKDPRPADGSTPYLFLPLPLQVDIEESPIKRLLVHGPAGISKSYGARWHLYKRCRLIPGYQALLLRVSLEQLKKNHLKYMESEAAALGDAEYRPGPREMHFENGAMITMGYCDSLTDIGQHLGPEWDECMLEEAVHFLPEAINEITARDRGSAPAREAMYQLGLMEGRSRLLTNPGGRAALFLEDHYIKRTPDLKKFPKYEARFYGAIHGDIRDNPYLSENFLSAGLGGLEAKRYEQLAAGRWDVFPGQAFPMFNPAIHVQEIEP